MPWDCSTLPKLALSCCAFQGTLVPVLGTYCCGRGCLILIAFRLLLISCFTLSLKCFSSDSDCCPNVVIRPLLQFPHPPRAGPVLLTLLFPPSSFILLSFAWVHTFFPTGQVLLSALSWRSACTSVSEGVFLMYPLREMCSMSSYSPAILYLLLLLCLFLIHLEDLEVLGSHTV